MRIAEIEASVYPAHMCMLQGSVTSEEGDQLADYCECSIDELVILRSEYWYALIADHHDGDVEVCDLAALPGHEFGALKALLLAGAKWQGRTVTLDARGTTSYPIIQRLARVGRITILRDEEYYWGREEMHELCILLSPTSEGR